MIIWISGNTGSGKTYLANHLKPFIQNVIHLDGDTMRRVWTDLGLSKEDRWENNLRVARLAKVLHDQTFNVIVSVIAPCIKLREYIDEIYEEVERKIGEGRKIKREQGSLSTYFWSEAKRLKKAAKKEE